MKNILQFPVARGLNPLAGVRAAAVRSIHLVAQANPDSDDVHDLFPPTAPADVAPKSGQLFAWFHLASLLTICTLLVLALNGCGGGYPGLALTDLKASAVEFDAGQSITIAVGQVGTHEPVTWTITGTGCVDSGCGTATSTGIGSAVYQAPAGLTAPIKVTITASMQIKEVSSSTVVTVNPDPAFITPFQMGLWAFPTAA